jgi:hypothetical protein
MAETFQWGKTRLWVAGNFRSPNMDSARVLYRVAPLVSSGRGESKHAAHRAHIHLISNI